MTTPATLEDELIIEENAAYVLGMCQLYQNDQEVFDALLQKGIKSDLIPRILQKVRMAAYAVRIAQGKRMMISGGSISVLLLLLYLFFTNLPGTATFLQDNLRGSGLRFLLLYYKFIFALVLFSSVLQFTLGINQFRKYSKLFRNNVAMRL